MTSITAAIYPIFNAIAFTFIMGATGVILGGRTLKRSTPVRGLLFHSLYSDCYRFALSTISVSHFKSVLLQLKKYNFYPTCISECCPVVDKTPLRRIPKKLLLTFDDGCRSFFTHAVPVLEELKIKAAFFPVAGYIGKTSTWDILPTFTHVSKSELREISSLGHEIGSHGLSHADLTFLANADLTRELRDSKKIIEDITGRKVTVISFPYGSWNKRVWEQAQEAGYHHGTIYRRHNLALPGLYPVYGVYKFDTPQAVVARISPRYFLSVSVACARMMSHFAKGASLWRFDQKYRLGG